MKGRVGETEVGRLKGCTGTNRDCDLPWGTELGTEPILRGFQEGGPAVPDSVLAWVLVGLAPGLLEHSCRLVGLGGSGGGMGGRGGKANKSREGSARGRSYCAVGLCVAYGLETVQARPQATANAGL